MKEVGLSIAFHHQSIFAAIILLRLCELNSLLLITKFIFNLAVPREPLTHKAAVYYHQQLALQEDQGIDLTQSPGRDSPGSSSGSAGSGSRHSTASLDSGRASSYHTQSSTSRGALSSPRCSVSSCSIGSVDRMSQRSVSTTFIRIYVTEA